MKEKGTGQYDLEYKNCNCFWGNDPGKFVVKSLNYLKGTEILDIGAGEGKNAIFLAKLGYKVEAVEVSEFAIENFKNQLKLQKSEINSRINIICKDVTTLSVSKKYNAVIAYGLLHCLYSLEQVDKVVELIKGSIEVNGIAVIVAFNELIGIPNVQDYLEPTLLPINYLKLQFKEWRILEYENDIITETHPTTCIEHQHSLTRIIAQKIN